MTDINEIKRYLENKKQIFTSLVQSIAAAEANGQPRVYLNSIKILDEEIDAIAEREEWPVCLEKARIFFEELEDYESCQLCTELMNKISFPKKIRKNGRKK